MPKDSNSRTARLRMAVLAAAALGIVLPVAFGRSHLWGARTAVRAPAPPRGGAPDKPGWSTMPNSSLKSVCPESPAIQAVLGCRGVIDAWNGAIADTKRDRLIIWGGGHGDYFGNEVYALDLGASAMKRLTEPSPVDNVEKCPEAYVDGLPSSRHTYEGLSYIAHADRMFVFGGAKSSCGFFSDGTWTLDLATLHWQLMNPSGSKPGGGPGQVSDYDPNSKLVYLHDYIGGLYAYNFDSNNWKQVLSDGYGIDYHMSGAIDPKRKIFVIAGGLGNHAGGLQVFKVGGGSSAKSSPKIDPSCKDALSVGSPGVAYDSVLDKIVIWPNFGSTVFLLNESTWTCQAVTYPNGPAEAGQNTTTGTFGRFRYFPDKDVFALVNQAGGDAFLLKLSSATAEASQEKKN